MRHATWQRLDASPFCREMYTHWRRLPEQVRAPFRVLLLPHWHAAAFLVRFTARNRVVDGPFRGMRLHLSGVSSRHLLGYILGSQELELRSVILRIIERGYATVLNIGAADGYYAVGLARQSPSTRVEAFEALPELHPLIARSARLNGVEDRLLVRGACDMSALRASLQQATSTPLVLMDIEGGEIELLDPIAAPELRRADILVETHDSFVPKVTETLIDRFAETHNVECYTAMPRILADFPEHFMPRLRRHFSRLAVDLMDERRTGVQRWLYLTVRAPAPAEELAKPNVPVSASETRATTKWR